LEEKDVDIEILKGGKMKVGWREELEEELKTLEDLDENSGGKSKKKAYGLYETPFFESKDDKSRHSFLHHLATLKNQRFLIFFSC
jgi:hypothetical protein